MTDIDLEQRPSLAGSAVPATESAPATVSKIKLKNNKLYYDGAAGKIFQIGILNFFLSCLTLGIYSFWGKTRLRRYLVGSLSVNGRDRFEYTGTAMELLKGWAKAMLIISPLAVLMIWSSGTHYAIYTVSLLVFYTLLSAGIYLAMRYRLSRTRWRGIRFGLQGKVLDYMILSAKRSVLNVITLGYLIPHSDIVKWSYMANHMTFGKTGFAYQGSPKNLIKINLLTLWGPALLYVALTVILIVSVVRRYREEFPAVFMIAFYGIALLAFLARQWYRAELRAARLRGLKLEGLRFKSTATGGGYLNLRLGNILIMLFTLGLGFAIVANRNMRFESATVFVGGDLDQLVTNQPNPVKGSDIGDELAPDLDMGAALSIGI